MSEPGVLHRRERRRRLTHACAVLAVFASIVGYGSPAGTAGAAPDGFVDLPSPVRLLDTRPEKLGILEQPGGSLGADLGVPLEAAVPSRFVVAPVAGIPADPAGLALNLAVTGASGSGFVRLWPCASINSGMSFTSTINYQAGLTKANGAIIDPDDATGGLCILSSRTVHVIIDTTGHFAGGFVGLALPVRLLDTRLGLRGAIEQPDGSLGYDYFDLLSPGIPTRFVLAPGEGIPADPAGLALNVAVLAIDRDNGVLHVWPCASVGTPKPLLATIFFRPFKAVANNVVVDPDDATGGVCLESSKSAHVIVDTTGYFDGGFEALPAPVRLLDTRPELLGVIEEPSGSVGTDLDMPLQPGVPSRFVVAPAAGIPADPSGVLLNVTVTGAFQNGFVRLWPCESVSTPPPPTSTINFQADFNGTIANAAIIDPHDQTGGLCVVSSQFVDVILDATGYFVGP